MKELMSKTRKILVDTARQLFAQKGIDNTTMNNIALASGKDVRCILISEARQKYIKRLSSRNYLI